MLKVDNKDKTWRSFGAFIVNCEHITHVGLMFLLITLIR